MSAEGQAITLIMVSIIFLAGISAISEFSENADASINDSDPLQNSLDSADQSTFLAMKLSGFAPLILGAGLLFFVSKKFL